MRKKHIFLRVFSKITIFACVFCAFFVSPTFATLPAVYTELEYIESTGTQYIDTGVYCTSDSIEYDFTLVDSETKINVSLFGSQSPYSGIFNSYDASVGNAKPLYIGSTRATKIGYELSNAPTRCILTISNGTATLTQNGETKGNVTYSGTIVNNKSIYIFSNNGSSGQNASYSLYHWAMKDNGILVRNFIPAKRNSDGEIGMYDMVSNTFFTNSGTGDFIAGPVAEIKIATTKFVDEEFKAAEANLAATVQTIESVVSRTITQTGQIQVLQDTKQTRPDENCPANMKCLLVQDEDGTPHWYPIIEP